jgi:hypothetical protein
MTIKAADFTKHPRDVGMTYFQHFRFALNLARLTFAACGASLVHAVFPFLFVNTTSKIISRLYFLLKSRIPNENLNTDIHKNKVIDNTQNDIIRQSCL